MYMYDILNKIGEANRCQAIEAGRWELSADGQIVYEIKLIADQLENVKWKKISRLCNEVAHSLGKAAILAFGSIFWKEVGPPCLVGG